MRKISLTFFVLFFATGCSDDVGLTGVWTGISASSTGLTLTLIETGDGLVSGAGRLVIGLQSLPVNATGAHSHPSISLTIDAARLNFAPVNFQGVFDGPLETIHGVLNNANVFLSDSLVLHRTTAPAATRITAP
jgi:hypothetical protein